MSVREAADTCGPPRYGPRSDRSPDPDGHHGPRRGRHGFRLPATLGCLAERLNIIGDSGVDEAALDALLESLSADSAFTAQLQTLADTCLAAVNPSLTAQQQGAFVLACLRLSQASECQQQDADALLCLNADTLFKCPIGIHSLVQRSALDSCWRETKLRVVPNGAAARPDGGCAALEERARTNANCSLQAAGLASGDTVDLTAVQAAITASTDTTDTEKALQQSVLSTCQANGADTVEAFLDCWATESADGCVTSIAERLATAPVGRPSGGVHPLGAPPRGQPGGRGRR
ncbi:hypothetical protein FJT64_011329 [Amphibalanus amphitrite]|uniref:Uncharacterized protein n=1 Tax=Amphibalanus amphitrite TaxID=1232801 RepID=A0A6A4VJF2_AMPAM|nr:hypothetical protein FJT64_011329 [Amphibalanus amphitrite]